MARPQNSIRSWALVAVAVSSIFTIAISLWLIYILSGQDWCSRALGAAKYAAGRPEIAISACFSLMGQQVDTLGWALKTAIGVQALSLLVLIVIVLAGGRLSFKGPGGIEADMGSDPSNDPARARAQGAYEAADAAESRAQALETEAG